MIEANQRRQETDQFCFCFFAVGRGAIMGFPNTELSTMPHVGKTTLTHLAIASDKQVPDMSSKFRCPILRLTQVWMASTYWERQHLELTSQRGCTTACTYRC